MKKFISLLVVAMIGFSTSSAQALLSATQSSTTLQTDITGTPYYEEILDMSFPTELVNYFSTLSDDDDREEKIDMFLAQNRKYLPKYKIPYIKETLMGLSESRLKTILMYGNQEFKDPTMVLVVSLFLGELGIDRFILGEVGAGILKLITAGGFGIWYIVDWFIIMDKTRNYNYNELMELCVQY